jgi:anti-anti-sigma regulatory factor
MTTQLDCAAAHEPPLTVLRTAGALNLATAPDLRTALLKCLADQPAAVLVDAAGLIVADDLALTAFIAAARHAAAWPGVPLLVCAAPKQTEGALRRLGIDRYITLCADLDHGRAAAARRDLPLQVRDRLPPTAESVPAARRLVTAVCERWDLPGVTGSAAIVITELAANVVRHARTGMELVITRGARQLHLAVRDGDSQRPHLVGPAGEEEPGGRGLLLVEAVSTSWGYTLLPDGKVTWASLSTVPPPPGRGLG